MKITHASALSDSALIAELGRLTGQERAVTVALIVHLAEFDARRLYAGAGYSSTFRYCLEVLRLSEDAAFNRIEVARGGQGSSASAGDAPFRSAESDDRPTAGTAADGAERPRAAGRRRRQEQTAGRGVAGPPVPTTGDFLRRAQDLLGHAIPSGELDQVFNRALRLLVRELEREKFATTERPRRSRGSPRIRGTSRRA